MAWLMAKIYDRFMAQTEEACLREWRAELLSGLEGSVLEIGAGTGANLEFYGDRVTRIVATEPDRHMRAKLESKDPRVECVDAQAESLPFDDAVFNHVVSTLVLCSVDSVSRSLSEIWRVLKPGGDLIFLEHVESERDERRRWQHRLEPFWSLAAGNCHLTRETHREIAAAGFVLEEQTRESMRKALPIIRETVRGRAQKPLERS